MPAVSRPAAPAAPSAAQKALQKMGLRRDIDLALHLPLRYEDETRITPLASARDGQTVQIEATVTACEVQLRPRRQLDFILHRRGFAAPTRQHRARRLLDDDGWHVFQLGKL